MAVNGMGVAGTMESSDISITIEKSDDEKVEIKLSSVVKEQYGEHIEALIHETLKELSVSGVKVRAIDRGALDCTIKARVQAAAYRALGLKSFNWEAL